MIPTISHNIDAPIFPLTALGITVKFEFIRKYKLVKCFSMTDVPQDFNHNPYNLRGISV
ncbi:MAG: hypothetical protein R2759_09400 [Bacteroidales bacterium]